MTAQIPLRPVAEDTPLSPHNNSALPFTEDTRRARELYRHVQPHNFLPKAPANLGGCGDKVTALGDTLEPYVQLASLRCHAPRAFITLIDRESQYFLAEASRAVHTDLAEAFEKHERLLWLGCGVSKSGKLCEITVQLPPSSDPYPIFEVQNLALDSRFSNLPFVQGGPQLRFYAGTPLTTKRGINIGSLCVMDVEPRGGLDAQEIGTLGWLAGLVITHLETTRAAIEGRRAKLMSHALDAFVDGRSGVENSSGEASRAESVQRDQNPRARMFSNRPTRTPFSDRKSGGAINSHALSARPPSPNSADFEESLEDCHTSTKDPTTTCSDSNSEEEEDSQGRGQHEAGSESHGFTFGRAANILRECFDIGDGDGVFFLEAGTGLADTTGSGNAISAHQETRDGKGLKNGRGDTPSSPTFGVGTNTSFDPLINAFIKQAAKPAPVLASSIKDEPFLRVQHPRGRSALGEIDQDVLGELCKRYPQGKIWSLEDGAVASASEDDQAGKHAYSTSSQRRNRSQHRDGEASIMSRLFPGARQVLFVPLWDAAASRWACGCFIWSTSETRVFTKATDLGFLSVFGKTIMAECSRLDTLLADKQKADFIGSISHELRSPLHGILAGAEFLSETASTAFQKSLVETIEACGRTLLDTINHVLDFSKINTLDRNWRNNREPRKKLREGEIGHGAQTSAKQLPSGAPPLLRLYAVTDIAAVTEEVVEGLSVGQIYSQATDLTDISGGNRGLGADRGMRIAPRTHGGRESAKQADRDAIEVLLDIAREDWVFMAQPGAIRRIIMNVFGNSIKYTSCGTIKVRLRLETVPGSDPDHAGKMMVLTISDTGKGISARFLSSRLFVPFAQENSLSPGTGLGLSIVRSIVMMLGGNLDLQSKFGEGTTVQVSLPLMRAPPGSESTQSTPRSTSTTAPRDESVQSLRDEAKDCSVAIYEHSESHQTVFSSREYAKVFAGYIREWYGLQLRDWADRGQASVLVIEERDVSEVLQGDVRAGMEGFPALIVLCSNATRHSEAEAEASDLQSGVSEYISKPCGPYKLARALRSCLGRMRLLKSTHPPEGEGPLTGPKDEAENEKLNELDLPAVGKEEASIPIQANGTLSASAVSRNAQIAINGRLADGGNSRDGFPFPQDRSPSITSPLTLEVQNLSKWTEDASRASPPVKGPEHGPRILLVDDNKINLQLLQTFMHKRQYVFVDSAEDGNIAVNAVKASTKPYDIIFMDISMPVMNGFEATRAIRNFEAENQVKPAMVIALTGLANGRDQAEGFSSGCDIYMTKPVSFKELAKLLKNWEANMDTVSHPSEYNFVTMRGGLARGGDAD